MASINSVSSGNPVQAPPKTAPVEATEATRPGKDLKNNTGQEGASAASTTAKASEPKPVTNTMGQVTGRTLNVTA